MKKVAVSACLLGKRCRYDGKCKTYDNILKYLEDKEVFEICPEVLGGLPTPRTPCEIINGKVMDQDGNDKTYEYELGAKKALEIIKQNNIKEVILKSKSPSCGILQIYDGTFTRKLIDGQGIFAKLLEEEELILIDSDTIDI